MINVRVDVDTVDGSEIRKKPVEVGSLSHYFYGFIHPKWCRISFSTSSSCISRKLFLSSDFPNMPILEGWMEYMT